MLIWGGGHSGSGAGERYDPLTDSWSLMSTVGDPTSSTDDVTAVWTGHYMVVWGGGDCPVGCYLAGGRYDPVSDAWLPISTSGSPGGRVYHSAVWTGTRMIVWGGNQGAGLDHLNSGGVYNPEADVWMTTSTVGAPAGRAGHAAVWTGSRMLVWGGLGVSAPLNSGGRYDPATNTWAAMSIVDAPSPRYHDYTNLTAIWTGSRMVVWGGTNGSSLFGTGGRYNPVADTWSPTSIAGAPEPRQDHTAIWTGNKMIVWGGSGAGGVLASGGRYDPLTDQWAPMSLAGAPSSRELHTAVWAGSEMIVWGGYPVTNTGGRYASGQLTDDDGDGVSECAGDCDDTRADIHPGAAEVCDGRDDNCDGFIPPEGADVDEDGVRDCAGDCDDHDPTRFPGNPELCDGVDNDCNGSADGQATSCGVGGCARAGVCTFGVDSCIPGTPSAEVCNGIDDDCNGALPAPEADLDGDGVSICAGDCDDGDPLTFAGAPEVNDALDNQCPGDAGFGLVDEVSGTSGFSMPGDPTRFCWPAQTGATEYLALRSSAAGFSGGCASAQTAATCWSDPTLPPAKTVLYYLVRAVSPNPGSLGATSAATERAAVCGTEFACGDGVDDDGDGRIDCADLSDCYGAGACDSATFSFTDGPGDDLATQALKDFFAAVPEDASDYLQFSLAGPTLTDFEWCTARADFYGSSYLALAPTSGTVTSGAWDKWHRTQGGSWIGPDSAGYDNLFGDDCAGTYSWCSEAGLGGHIPGIAPAEPAVCEAFDDIDCSDGTWTLSIKVGVNRVAACGF
jgi:N-acetylneuraminic acid mutarotase